MSSKFLFQFSSLSVVAMERYLLLLFALVGANSYKWTGIEIITEELKGYNNASESIKHLVQQQLETISEEADEYISNLEKQSIIQTITKLPDNDVCKKNLTSLSDLKVAFKIQFSKNQRDLMNWFVDIMTKLTQAISEVSSYEKIADGKMFACNLRQSNCSEKTNVWLEDNLNSLRCRLITRCTEHTVSKRSISNPCSQSQFYCPKSNRCISSSYACDGSCNCSPCDDEPKGCSRYCHGGFHCNNLRCIKKDGICNDVDDCGDGSDEESCPTKCSVETDTFNCNNGTCIGLGKVCDGKNDCDDGSDEGGLCGMTSCENSCSTADGVCLGTPKGSMCLSHCPPGTSETSAGCLPGPKPSATISEMLEDLPRILTRYQSLYKWLQRKTVGTVVNSIAEVSKCKGGVFESLDDIILLGSLNNRTTTHRPHTTTHHPHTTSHHPHTTSHHPHTTSHHPHTTTHHPHTTTHHPRTTTHHPYTTTQKHRSVLEFFL